MADGTQTPEEQTALVPVSLATARAGLVSHPLAVQAVGLARLEEAPPSYADQMAATGLGFDDADGARRLWTVSKHPLYGPDGQVWPGAFGTQRDDTGARLGVVGPRYKPLQNAQLADAIDVAFRHMPPAFRPRIVNAGALGGGAGFGAGDDETQGARVFAQLALPAELSGLPHLRTDEDSRSCLREPAHSNPVRVSRVIPYGKMTRLTEAIILNGRMTTIDVPSAAAFGAAIRQRRREKSLTQTELAELCGVSLRFVSELERGRATASVGRALLLAQRLGLDPVLLRREER